jgi:hypothetical protein
MLLIRRAQPLVENMTQLLAPEIYDVDSHTKHYRSQIDLTKKEEGLNDL